MSSWCARLALVAKLSLYVWEVTLNEGIGPGYVLQCMGMLWLKA